MLISIGGVAIYAVRIGQGDVDGANDVFRHGILLQLCAAAVFSLLGTFFADGICSLLGANETFHHLAVDYLFWYSIFIIPSGLSIGLQNYCRNDKRARPGEHGGHYYNDMQYFWRLAVNFSF